jgi:hypothetical protein
MDGVQDLSKYGILAAEVIQMRGCSSASLETKRVKACLRRRKLVLLELVRAGINRKAFQPSELRLALGSSNAVPSDGDPRRSVE